MSGEAIDSHLDLSAGENPDPESSKAANELLADAASRRRYRRYSFGLAVLVVGFLSWILCRLIAAVTTYITSFSPWVVGMVATLVIAIAVITLALLKATFSGPSSASQPIPEMPQITILSDAIKVFGDSVRALRDTIGK